MTDPRRFDCAPSLRLQGFERVSGLQIDGLNARLDRIEALIERLERRMWIAVYGIVGAVLAQAFQSLLTIVPGG